MNEVINLGLPHVAQHIFKHFDNSELVQFLAVSPTWRQLICEEVLVNRVDEEDNHGRSLFTLACMAGYPDVIEIFLNHSKNQDGINDRCHNGKTAFMLACEAGHTDVVNILLHHLKSQGISFNAKCNNGMTAFMLACEQGNTAIMQLLMDHSEKKNIKLNQGFKSAFILACELGKIDDVNLLVNSNLIHFNLVCEHGKTGFMHACEQGHIEVVKLLIDHSKSKQLNLNLRNKLSNGKTAFHYACESGQVEVVDLLLNHSRQIDLKAKCLLGKTAFMYACSRGKVNVIKILVHNAESRGLDLYCSDAHGKTAFIHACQSGHMNVVELLMEYHEPGNVCQHFGLDIRDIFGNTAFPWACRHERIDVIQLMMDHPLFQLNVHNYKRRVEFLEGFVIACKKKDVDAVTKMFKHPKSLGNMDWNMKDANEFTAFQTVCKYGLKSVAKMMLDHHFDDLYSIDRAFRWACLHGRTDVMKLVLDHPPYKLNVQDRNNDYIDGFFIACEKKDADTVTLLFNHSKSQDFDWNLRHITGFTAFQTVCSNGLLKVVQMILDQSKSRSIDLNAVDTFHGSIAFITACKHGGIEVVKLLIDTKEKTNFNPNARDRKNDWTGFMHACHNGNIDIVKLLLDNSERIGLEMNAVDSTGMSGLMLAYKKGHTSVFELLVEHSETKLITIPEKSAFDLKSSTWQRLSPKIKNWLELHWKITNRHIKHTSGQVENLNLVQDQANTVDGEGKEEILLEELDYMEDYVSDNDSSEVDNDNM